MEDLILQAVSGLVLIIILYFISRILIFQNARIADLKKHSAELQKEIEADNLIMDFYIKDRKYLSELVDENNLKIENLNEIIKIQESLIKDCNIKRKVHDPVFMEPISEPNKPI